MNAHHIVARFVLCDLDWLEGMYVCAQSLMIIFIKLFFFFFFMVPVASSQSKLAITQRYVSKYGNLQNNCVVVGGSLSAASSLISILCLFFSACELS